MIAAKLSIRSLSCLTIMLVTLLAASLSAASGTYVVRKGDNPNTIAKKHHIPVQALLEANNISAKKMKPGTRISIPSRNAHAKAKHAHAEKVSEAKGRRHKAEAAVKDEAPQPSPSAPSAKEDLYHTVRKGDTVASLSKKYSISAADLKEMNHLKSRKLRRGQRLLVRHIGPKTYVVKKGDTVWKIARKFDMDAEDLRRLNELDGKEIHTGQKLYLEEKVDEAAARNYHQILARNVEEELKKVAQSEEFADQPVQDKVVTFAKKMLNIPYKFGGTSILGIDCSGYVKKVYGLLGVDLPRTAREQFQEGEAIDRDDLSIGDLVFFRTYASFPSHVGIYMGNNLFIHASSKGKKVTIDSLETPYYFKRFIGGKRLLSRNATDEDPQS